MPARRKSSRITTRKSAKNLPKAPSIWSTLGPSFILLGLALGSGELILWPYLAANYGVGILWGGLLGISFQYVLNTETMRYTLAWGESVFVGFRKLSWLIPVWYILSTFIPWSLPGFSSAAAQIIARMTGVESMGIFSGTVSAEMVMAIALLLLTGTILTLGKVLYNTMELLQRTIILIGLPFMIVLTLILAGKADWVDAAWGLVGRGDGWWFFPPGIAIASFLGAFAYSGAGGNLNLAQSYYIKEKGWGMGKFTAKITSLLNKDEVKVAAVEGKRFTDTPANRRKWRQWWRMINLEHSIIFYGLGLLTIVIMVILSKILVFGQQVDSGLSFLYAEAAAITQQTMPAVGVVFLLIAALMLFSTQVGVLESSSRIISENVLLLFFRKGKKFNLSLAFYVALWAQIILGIIIYVSGVTEPRLLLTLSAVLNAAAMMVSFPLIYILNKKKLAKAYQPHWWRRLVMLLAFGFFVTFVVITAGNFRI